MRSSASQAALRKLSGYLFILHPCIQGEISTKSSLLYLLDLVSRLPSLLPEEPEVRCPTDGTQLRP
jgi:hypothetical protein